MFKGAKKIGDNTIRLILLIICLIAPFIIVFLYEAPEIEDIIKVNRLEDVISKFDSVLISSKGSNSYYYYERTNNSINFIQSIEKDSLLQTHYYYNNRLFSEVDGEIYYNYVEDRLMQ